MKIKRHYILIFFLVFVSLVSNAYAARGELRYEVTNFSLDGTKITFEGWAFLHQTNNYNTIYKLNYNEGYVSETKEVLLSNGGQKIKISAINKNTGETIATATVDGSDKKYYNFYKEMFFSFAGFEKTNKNLVECYNGTSNTGCDNKCSDNDSQYTECYYKDLYFKISFNVSDWNIEDDTQVYFKIAAYNNDYGKWKEENLHLGENVKKSTLSNNYIEVDKNTFSNKISFIANYAQLLNPVTLIIEKGGIYGNTGSNYLVKEIKEGNKNGNFISGSIGPGKYTLYISQRGNCSYGTNRCWLSTCSNPNTCNTSSKVLVAHGSWVKPTGTTSFTIKVKNDKKCAASEPASNKTMYCNEWKDLSSKCDALTVRNNGTSEMVKIEQKGYITNIFKSNLVNKDKNYDANSYNGGWLKYGITYYNEVSWNYTPEKFRSSEAQENINYAMQKKLKSLSEFEENINLTINVLDGSRLVKKCTQSGSFTPANKLITVCTFFLPESYLKELTGNVSYSESNDNANINNKYYIPLDAQKHNISVKLENLSVLSENQVQADSQNKNKPWTGTWTIDTSCSLKVTNRIYEPPSGGKENGKVKYKFIYRPINLSNPFPNRFPGVNWYTWYITEGNKDRKTLEDSYKKLEYYTELDNRTISTIKEYNKNHNYFSEVDKNFFRNYIKEGGNS